MLNRIATPFSLLVAYRDAASQSGNGGNGRVSMCVDSYSLMGGGFAENCGIWSGILPVRTRFGIGIGVVIFAGDRERCWF